MASEIKINKHDYLRVVLTDVQPYELPFIITNEGFYSNIKDSSSNDFLNNLFISYKELKPYDFKITKNEKSLRKLSLIHPFAQKKFASFYREHHDIIKSKCSISKFSLRYPVDIALYYIANREEDIESGLKDEGVDTVCESEQLIPAYASSFFTYKKYNFLYKFYDSYTFHRIERRFSKLHKFDISKCFENLSIDMLPTALRGEDLFISNQYSSKTFEAKFSELLSYSNYSRTHGIVIGPEFSRIYAEILLQKIDSQIELKLKELGIKYGTDYVIKRYVDDYFLFYNDDRLLNTIVRESVDILSNYKLFINESKNEDFTRPFITGVTSAKMSISSFFDELFSHVNVDTKSLSLETTSSFYNFNKTSNKLITKLKCIINSHNVEYESITGYFLTIMRKKIAEIGHIYGSAVIDSKTSDSISRFLLLISELMFFIYSMDSRVRSTYLVSEIIIQISDICKKLSYESELMITDKIIQEAKFSIKNALKGVDNVESLNLALSLQVLNTENSLSTNDLKSLLNISDSNNNINYFQLVVGLYFIKNQSNFYKVKRELCDKAFDKVINTLEPLKDSECVHIIFDTLTCPYLTSKYKNDMVDKLYDKNVIPHHIEKRDFFDTISKNKWFVDWSELSIKRLLKKKQLRSPY
ncbi:TPA: RNA-directed DNA polymerase [Vibrio parahaemolyticus]|nr:RNA-directed DNA polymerase [Vibrio parahaemolyticus]